LVITNVSIRSATDMTSTPPQSDNARGASAVLGRRLILVAVAAAIAGALITLSFTYADHAPAAHGVRIAVVAPPSVTAHVAAGLRRAAPGAFQIVAMASAPAARAALHDQRVRGALVLGPGGASGDPARAQILTAGAAGTALQQVVESALGHVATAAGARTSVQDVVPPSAADRPGLMSYVFELGLLVPSVLGSVGLYLVGLRSRLWWRVAAAALFAALVAAFGTLIVATGFGALPGHWAATFGIGMLGALAFVLSVGAAQATVGLPATGAMAILFIFVGNATSGGSVPTAMLPAVYRQISPWLPNGAIVHAIRTVVYFNGDGLGQPLLALALWAGAAGLVLAVNDLVHHRECRLSPGRTSEIYSTPGLAHARRIARRRRIARNVPARPLVQR
jgi:hypothetical protein